MLYSVYVFGEKPDLKATTLGIGKHETAEIYNDRYRNIYILISRN